MEPRKPKSGAIETRDIPPLCVRADFIPKSVDAEARTVEVVFSTGAAVTRHDWWTGKSFVEKLSIKSEHVRLDRLNGGAPVLNAHSAWSIEDQIGVVVSDSAKIVGKEARATIQFSQRETVGPIWQDVRDGIVRNVSVGYRVHEFEETAGTDGKLPTRTAIDWEPYEISMVPMPADASAQVRGGGVKTNKCALVRAQEEVMDEENNEGGNRAATPEATRLERERIGGIQRAIRAARLDESIGLEMIDQGVTLEAARADILRRLEENQARTPTRGHFGNPYQDSANDTVPLMAEAIAARFGGPAASAEAAPYRHMRLIDLGRELLEMRGVSARRQSDVWVATRLIGHTTSDFPSLLTESGNRLLRQAYEAAPAGVRAIAREALAPDFRPLSRLQLSEAPELLEVLESGEVTRGSAAESKESYSVKTYGRIFSLTRQAIVNDDLGAFADFARRQGRAAAELIAKQLVTLLTSNPVMSDGIALFHASHANLGTAATISTATLGEALKLMRRQMGLDGKTPINATPRFLLVPAALEVLAKQQVAAITATKAADVNPFSAELEVVVDPRLDDDSATAWYVASDPSVIDGIEYAFLDDAPGPQFASREGFDVLGLELRVTLDFGAGIIDHRGLVKNVGA